MRRHGALQTIFESLRSNDIVISTTGLISREIFERFDSEKCFYMPGSMGMASSVGLSLAVCAPKIRVVVIDGDASLLMNLGSMVTIGHVRPINFLHLVLDNGAYASCSEEKSMSKSAQFVKMARLVGYQYVVAVDSVEKLRLAFDEFIAGPGFIHAKIHLGGRRDFVRPTDLVEIKKQLMQAVALINKRSFL